jgi:transposase-like protein
MDHKSFHRWLCEIDHLTEAQKAKVLETLADRPPGVASVAAVEQSVGADRTCPHCQAPGAVANGKNRGLQRYLCRSCKRTFSAATGTPLSGLHHKDRWLEMASALADGDTLKTTADRCGVHISTAHRWRHRFLNAVETGAGKLKGIVEADETFILASRKGDRTWTRAKDGKGQAPDRKPRKRGGRAVKRGRSDEQVPVLMAADRSGTTVSAVLPLVSADAIGKVLAPVVDKDALLVTDGATCYPPCAAALGLSHETLNQSAGERRRGELHIQTVNNRHSRLKDFLRPRRGIATRYLGSYLKWFHLIALHSNPTPRYCLRAAMGA